MKPDPAKIKVVKEASPPESKEAVRSSLVGYLSKFILRYTSLTASLQELTHTNTEFKWESEEGEAFRQEAENKHCK